MSSPNTAHTFLSLIPTAHRVAVISPSEDLQPAPVTKVVSVSEESIIPTIQKTRRSSSTATTESNDTVGGEEAIAPVDSNTSAVVESPVEAVNAHKFLKLGN